MNEFKPEESLKNRPLTVKTILSLPDSCVESKVVLGIDIYKYSQYPPEEQIYVPVIFERIYAMTVYDIGIHEKYFFSDYGYTLDDFKNKFISTGDGGFQIFDNPLQAIIFSLYFQTFLKRYCTGGSINQIDKNLFQIIDTIDLRFAISYDKVYWYNNNYFGPAIINNARILSRDSLNRLLVDANTIKWLSRNINAPENLLDIDKISLNNTSFFKNHDKKLTSFLFDKSGKILALDIQKIGTLTAKETKLDIFNMHLQAKLKIKVEHQDYGIYIITLGNLNTSGIDNKNSA